MSLTENSVGSNPVAPIAALARGWRIKKSGELSKKGVSRFRMDLEKANGAEEGGTRRSRGETAMVGHARLLDAPFCDCPRATERTIEFSGFGRRDANSRWNELEKLDGDVRLQWVRVRHWLVSHVTGISVVEPVSLLNVAACSTTLSA